MASLMLTPMGMQALPKKLLPLILFGIAVTSLCSVQRAQAFTVTMQQVGANVVATGNGAIDLSGLNFLFSANGFGGAAVEASFAILSVGPSAAPVSIYNGLTGPASFGSGGAFFANSGSGDWVTVQGAFGNLWVPQGYVSGTALSSSDTWNNATFASLGLTPGTYEWTWGDGGANQNCTLEIGTAPDGGTTISLLGCALLGLAVLRRKLAC